MKEQTIRHPMCPKCRGFSRYVRRSTVFPKEPLTMAMIFYCFECKIFARANREGKPMEGMAPKALHKLRQKTISWLETTGMSPGDFQTEMDRAPWDMNILLWDRGTCNRALKTVLNERPSPVEKELLS
jgi:hypothetical protein